MQLGLWAGGGGRRAGEGVWKASPSGLDLLLTWERFLAIALSCPRPAGAGRGRGLPSVPPSPVWKAASRLECPKCTSFVRSVTEGRADRRGLGPNDRDEVPVLDFLVPWSWGRSSYRVLSDSPAPSLGFRNSQTSTGVTLLPAFRPWVLGPSCSASPPPSPGSHPQGFGGHQAAPAKRRRAALPRQA